MERTIELQEEFEKLVSQLERLKSINELTSSNANSAKTVINEIEEFIMSVEQFREAIEQDLSKKNESIELLLAKLNQTIVSVENKTDKSLNEHAKKIVSLHEKSDLVLMENKNALSKELYKFVESLNYLQTNISQITKNSLTKIEELIKVNNKLTDNQLQEMGDLINNRLCAIEDGIVERHIELFKYFDKKYDDMENKVNGTFEYVNKCFDKKNRNSKTIKFLFLIIGGLTLLFSLLAVYKLWII